MGGQNHLCPLIASTGKVVSRNRPEKGRADCRRPVLPYTFRAEFLERSERQQFHFKKVGFRPIFGFLEQVGFSADGGPCGFEWLAGATSGARSGWMTT